MMTTILPKRALCYWVSYPLHWRNTFQPKGCGGGQEDLLSYVSCLANQFPNLTAVSIREEDICIHRERKSQRIKMAEEMHRIFLVNLMSAALSAAVKMTIDAEGPSPSPAGEIVYSPLKA